METEIEDYNKSLINKQAAKNMFQDRINAFKAKQQALRRKKYDDFIQTDVAINKGNNADNKFLLRFIGCPLFNLNQCQILLFFIFMRLQKTKR